MPSPLIGAALFDYDGTLVDTDALHQACWNKCLQPFGLQLGTDFYSRNCSGELSIRVAQKLIATFPAITLDAQSLKDQKDRYYAAWIQNDRIPCRSGVPETLAYLKSMGISIGIVTGAPLSAIEPTLKEDRLWDYFETVVTLDDIQRGKPDPAGYQLAMQRLNVLPGQGISFEDSRNGVLAAKNAGLLCIAVPSGFTAAHDFSEADFICTDWFLALAKLQSLISGMQPGSPKAM